MTSEHAPIDFMSGQFVILGGFQRVPPRRISKVIRGCGASMGSFTTKKVSPVRFLIGDRFEPSTKAGHHVVVVDGCTVGYAPTAEECVDLTGAEVFGEDAIIASTGIGLSSHERMSMLRGALQGTPSQSAWNHAVAVLEAWEDALGVEDAIRYVADLTADWPPSLCVAPPRWVKRSVKAPAKRMRVAGALEVRSGDDVRKVARALDGAPRLQALTFRLAGSWRFPLRTLEAVLAHPQARQVREIVFDAPMYEYSGSGPRSILMRAPLPRLERLGVRRLSGRPSFSPAELRVFSARLPAVQVMDLDGVPL